jgi:hypothetical protein
MRGDTVSRPIWEGDYVRHAGDKFVGLHVGFTRMAKLMERSGDLRGVRVQLPDGSIRIASEHNLEIVDLEDYKRYAKTLGVDAKGRKLA